MENERGRGREKAVVAENRGEREEGKGAPKERNADGKSERETGRAERVDRWAPTTPKVRALPPGTKGRRRGDDARFINIYRRTLNSSLVANENRYRDWSWRSSPRDLMTFYGHVCTPSLIISP